MPCKFEVISFRGSVATYLSVMGSVLWFCSKSI